MPQQIIIEGVDEIIAKATNGANGDKFMALYKGEWQKLGCYPSQSEADSGFASMLAYWTDCNASVMDAVFRQSGLMCPKWDELHGSETYGQMTISRAISDFTNFTIQSTSAMSNQTSVKPTDYTDVGNANIFAEVFKNSVIYVKSLGFLVWTGQYWHENDLAVIAMAMNLSEKMLNESLNELSVANTELKIAESLQDYNRIKNAKQLEKPAKEYHSHALYTREAPKLLRMLELSKPALHVELESLDANPFILNTPDGVIDLRTGTLHPHAPEQLCTKITSVSPNLDGYQEWANFLQIITCGDKSLEDFLQQIVGMAALGKVFTETIIAAFGSGANGKSTFFNTINAVLGTYGGNIKPETLTMSRNNKSAEVMTLKGKRLVIAAELEEGEYLSSSMLKRLASVDRIKGERKYSYPESFTPSHSLVLFTNHLPKVASTDSGT